MEARLVIIFFAIFAQTKSPVYIAVPCPAPVAHCDPGWHLERWYEEKFPDVKGAGSGYKPIWFIGNHDFADSKEHPLICAKDTKVK